LFEVFPALSVGSCFKELEMVTVNCDSTVHALKSALLTPTVQGSKQLRKVIKDEQKVDKAAAKNAPKNKREKKQVEKVIEVKKVVGAAEKAKTRSDSKVKSVVKEKEAAKPDTPKLGKNAKKKMQRKDEEKKAEELRKAIYDGINGYS